MHLDLMVVGNLTNYFVLPWIGNQLNGNNDDDKDGSFNTGNRNMQLSYGVRPVREPCGRFGLAQ